MPLGFEIVDPRTVQGPDGQKHDVLDAIQALSWTPQLCPLMRHEYTIWKKGRQSDWPEWAWNVLSSMLQATNPDSFSAYFRGYRSANRYWDAPDGLRYWRGGFEIDRGQPDDAGLRRVDQGGKRAKYWAGPPYAPDGIGLYEQDEKRRWWPTEAALEAGYQPCRSCEQTNRKSAIVLTPKDSDGVIARIATAEKASRTQHGRSLTRDELASLLRAYPDRERGPSDADDDDRLELDFIRVGRSVSSGNEEAHMAGSDVPKARVIRKLLEIRAREAPLGSSGYRGVLSQKAIAEVAGVRVGDVTKAAIELDQELAAAESDKVE